MPRTARDKRNEFVGVIIGGWGLETGLDPNSPLFSLPLSIFFHLSGSKRMEKEEGLKGRVNKDSSANKDPSKVAAYFSPSVVFNLDFYVIWDKKYRRERKISLSFLPVFVFRRASLLLAVSRR